MVDVANQTIYSAAKNQKKCQIFSFQDVQNGRGLDKILGAPQRGQKIVVNQSKPILVIVSIKRLTRQSFKKNYSSREIGCVVFTDSLLITNS